MTQLVSLKNGLCLSGNSYGAPILTKNCDNNDASQKIQISDKNSNGKVQWSTNNTTIDTYAGNLYNSNECGRGNDCDFLFQNTVGNIGVGKGPFQVRGWGSGTWAYPDGNNNVTQNGVPGGSTDTWWITLDEYNDCKQYGIPANQCSPQNRNDCTLYNNYLRDTCKPSQCPTTRNITDPACQAYCVANAGKCDTAVSTYCASNPNDTNFCGCYNTQKYATIIKLLGDNAQTYIPRCSVQECASNPGAYMTNNMLNTKCSDQQICLQQLNVNTSTTQLNDIVQTCSQKSASNSTTGALSTSNVPTTGTTSSTTSSASETSTTDRNLIIGGSVAGGVIILSSSIALIIYMRSRKA